MASPANLSQKPRILVVDDNVQNVEVLEASLINEGYDVLKAYSGPEALGIVRSAKPNLVLLDIRMPEMDGYEVCRQIKDHPETAGIPVIMVTVYNEIAEIEKGVEAGADDFLSKPVNRIAILNRVRAGLKIGKLNNELDRTLSYLRTIEETQRTAPKADG